MPNEFSLNNSGSVMISPVSGLQISGCHGMLIP